MITADTDVEHGRHDPGEHLRRDEHECPGHVGRDTP